MVQDVSCHARACNTASLTQSGCECDTIITRASTSSCRVTWLCLGTGGDSLGGFLATRRNSGGRGKRGKSHSPGWVFEAGGDELEAPRSESLISRLRSQIPSLRTAAASASAVPPSQRFGRPTLSRGTWQYPPAISDVFSSSPRRLLQVASFLCISLPRRPCVIPPSTPQPFVSSSELFF